MALFFCTFVIHGLAGSWGRSLLGCFPRRRVEETERVVTGIGEALEAGVGEEFKARGAESFEAVVSKKALKAMVCEKPFIAWI
jgi:hypothetical protein